MRLIQNYNFITPSYLCSNLELPALPINIIIMYCETSDIRSNYSKQFTNRKKNLPYVVDKIITSFALHRKEHYY